MTKRNKIIISVSVIAVVLALIGVGLYWGYQPVKDEEVTYAQLKSKLGKYFVVPQELPFEGEVNCVVDFPNGSGGSMVKMQKSYKKANGYVLTLRDENREIRVSQGELVPIPSEEPQEYTYKETVIRCYFIKDQDQKQRYSFYFGSGIRISC